MFSIKYARSPNAIALGYGVGLCRGEKMKQERSKKLGWWAKRWRSLTAKRMRIEFSADGLAVRSKIISFLTDLKFLNA